MNRKVFLEQLEQALAGMPAEEIREIVADYQEYFSDAQEAGRAEDEVVAALGSPQKLAKELKAQAHYRQWENHRSFGNLMRVVASVAGLGVLNFFLALPFMLYLLCLSIGYIVSGSLLIAGVALVAAWGGNSLFGWPELEPSLSPVNGKVEFKVEADGKPVHGVTLRQGRLLLTLEEDETASLQLRSGDPVRVSYDGGELKVDASNAAARQSIKRESERSVSLERGQMRALTLTSDGGESMVLAQDGDGRSLRWRMISAEASAAAGEAGQAGDLVLSDGESSLVIKENRLSLKDGKDHFEINGIPGLSLQSSAAVSGFVLLLVGGLGLVFCVWLTRLTWRGLVHYVRYQIDLVAGRSLGGNAV